MPSSAKRRPRSLADQLLARGGQGEITAEEQAMAAEASFRPVPRALLVPIERIVPSRDNPRKNFQKLDDLAESIAERGVLQPLLVRRDPERTGFFITVAGARRLLAARIVQGSDDTEARARVTALPAVVMDDTDRDAFADSLAENLAREDLSRAEVMEALLRLQDEYGWSARYIARRTGRSVGDVAELLGIARDDEVGALVRDELIAPTVGGQIRRLRKELQAAAIQSVRDGRVKTVADVQRLRRQEQARPLSDTGTTARLDLDRPISDTSMANDRADQPAVPVEGDDDQGDATAFAGGTGVSDIGHPVPTEAASVANGRAGEPQAARGRREVADAVDAVVQAVAALVQLEGPIDSRTLTTLQHARDDLTAYIYIARHGDWGHAQ